MKKCPYCAEEIQGEAIKCRYCGEMLDKKEKIKWYFTTSSLVVAFLCVGPLALPLVWFNPHLDRTKKIIITVIIAVLTYLLSVLLANSLKSINAYYNQMFQMLK